MTSSSEQPTTAMRNERHDVLHHQKHRFGGIKWGSAFFGWLTAVGTTVVLAGIAAALGIGLGGAGLAPGPGAAGGFPADPQALAGAGIVGAVVLGVVLFVSYYCGGYVAGRMSRFHGARQGIAVWIWAVVVAVALAVTVAVTGGGGLAAAGQAIPVDPSGLQLGALIAIGVALAVALLGAVLGGLAGMRFHRRVDRATPPVDVVDRPAAGDGTAPTRALPVQRSHPDQAPPGQAPPGQTPPSQTPPGQTPPSQTPPGQTPPSQTPPGQIPPRR